MPSVTLNGNYTHRVDTMRVEFDPEFQAEILARIKRKYDLFDSRRPGLHQSDLGYCITQTYWKRHSPNQITDYNAALFAVGLALEEVLLENSDDSHRPGPVTLDGIEVSPDHVTAFARALGELKSARISIPDGALEPKNGWPQGWIRQMKSYAYVQRAGYWPGIDTTAPYRLAVFLVIAAKVEARKFTFTDQELDEHWAWMLSRKAALEQAEAEGKPPEPYAYVESQKQDDWECVRCQFPTMCDAMLVVQNFVPYVGERHV